MSQQALFNKNYYNGSVPVTGRRPRNTDLIRSVSTDQHEILGWIQNLYDIDRFDIDLTYHSGRFYRKGIPEPRFKSDIAPRSRDVMAADATALPFRSNIFRSVIFDPPFIAGGGKVGHVRYKYGAFETLGDMWSVYRGAMLEIWRVLMPQGHLIFKCQDFINGRQQFLVHADIIKYAQNINFYARDLFVRLSKHVPIGYNHTNQCHSRKFHSYFIVFQKKIRRVRKLHVEAN